VGALSFTSPLILAALIALPLVWFLLRATPPSPKQARFPAFIILRQLTAKQETPDRTPWPLLLLRLLLVALLIAGLAGPVLNAPPTASGGGPVALIVDDSWAAASNWNARRDEIRRVIAEAAQSDRPVFILTTAPKRTPAPLQPLTAQEARAMADTLTPQPWASDRAGAMEMLTALDAFAANNGNQRWDIRWLSDGVAGNNDQAFADALSQRGDVVLLTDPPAPILRPLPPTPAGPAFRIQRLRGDESWEGAFVASARDGRELTRIDVTMEEGQTETDVTAQLPLALRNELGAVRIENASSPGAVQLIDARARRALIGLVGEARPVRNNLLDGAHYLRQSLNPYAEFLTDRLSAIVASDASVIILDDVAAMRSGDIDALSAWVEKGGVLIRFAGPVLAEAAQDRTPPLLPVTLRGGGRAFGGALTWETPQRLDAFPADSPFEGLTPPDDVFIRQQILAQPGGETTTRSWARLEDGTPLVTGERFGAGVIVLFHVTATPQWSDLPVSGVFGEMLRRLIFLSTLGPDSADGETTARQPPLRLLDGFARLERPGDTDPALTPMELADPAGPNRRPGFYGAPEAPLALNVIAAKTTFAPLKVTSVARTAYAGEPPRRLGPFLFAAALALLLIDGLATLMLAGRLRFGRIGAAAIIASMTLAPLAPDARAQPLDPEIDAKTIATTLTTRLAFVETGDPAMDKLSEQALAGLSRELYRRTALEPGPPVGINPETDDLSVYPFLYWPVVAGAAAPSETALANIENFMRFGGLILFDTRDDERAIGAGSTPEAAALQRILSQLNTPPLIAVDATHVLTRSFYLLNDLPGRLDNNPVWVAAQTSGANDSVTPLIIGGRDWAGAWASDFLGRPVKPMGQGGERAREFAYRAGVNIVMVAFTGNYKSDQVHTPILLERLGK
jgi:Domain of unknown function (DUF4159)/Aerotolerance regulator N-terminal